MKLFGFDRGTLHLSEVDLDPLEVERVGIPDVSQQAYSNPVHFFQLQSRKASVLRPGSLCQHAQDEGSFL